jgi:hypothetical protein
MERWQCLLWLLSFLWLLAAGGLEHPNTSAAGSTIARASLWLGFICNT